MNSEVPLVDQANKVKIALMSDIPMADQDYARYAYEV